MQFERSIKENLQIKIYVEIYINSIDKQFQQQRIHKYIQTSFFEEKKSRESY